MRFVEQDQLTVDTYILGALINELRIGRLEKKTFRKKVDTW